MLTTRRIKTITKETLGLPLAVITVVKIMNRQRKVNPKIKILKGATAAKYTSVYTREINSREVALIMKEQGIKKIKVYLRD